MLKKIIALVVVIGLFVSLELAVAKAVFDAHYENEARMNYQNTLVYWMAKKVVKPANDVVKFVGKQINRGIGYCDYLNEWVEEHAEIYNEVFILNRDGTVTKIVKYRWV